MFGFGFFMFGFGVSVDKYTVHIHMLYYECFVEVYVINCAHVLIMFASAN